MLRKMSYRGFFANKKRISLALRNNTGWLCAIYSIYIMQGLTRPYHIMRIYNIYKSACLYFKQGNYPMAVLSLLNAYMRTTSSAWSSS